MKRKRKLSRKTLKTVIIFAVVAILFAAVLITDIFIPVRYLSAYITVADTPNAGELRVRFLDVGYGDCTIVEFPDGKTMVIDGGDGSYSHELKVLTALNSARIDTIDYLVCTTVKDEHCGGLYELLKYKTVKTVYAPYLLDRTKNSAFERFMSLADARAEDVKICEYGESVVSEEGYAFAFLAPDPHINPNSAYKDLNSNFTEYTANTASAVLYLEYAGRKFLFLGDAPASVQSEIFEVFAIDKNYLEFGDEEVSLRNLSVVKVSGHGGANTFSEAFFDLISPEAAIISVGKSTHDAPNAATLELIRKSSKIYRTDSDGEVCVIVNDSGKITFSKEKK